MLFRTPILLVPLSGTVYGHFLFCTISYLRVSIVMRPFYSLLLIEESKTHLFLIHFSNMFLTVLDIFLCQIMKYSPTLCFACVN